jgi:hypothetical protein
VKRSAKRGATSYAALIVKVAVAWYVPVGYRGSLGTVQVTEPEFPAFAE